MRVIISELPKTDWWGEGITAYEDNWAMEEGVVPDQTKVIEQHNNLVTMLEKYVEIVKMPFPNTQKFPDINHDYVFVRDHFVSGNDNSIVICNFSRPERKQETRYTIQFLDSQGLKYRTLSDDALAEGGEFHYAPNENILFAGICRNNRKGVNDMAEKLDVNDVFVVESKAFHLDTFLSILLGKNKDLVAIFACMELIENTSDLKKLANKLQVELVSIDKQDAIGDKEHTGNLAVNGFILPGLFVNNSQFKTPGVEEKIKRLGVDRKIVSTSKFNLSGGSLHCLTNEI